jgi:hypothetical protein
MPESGASVWPVIVPTFTLESGASPRPVIVATIIPLSGAPVVPTIVPTLCDDPASDTQLGSSTDPTHAPH